MTPTTPTPRLGIAVDLDGLRELIRDFINEQAAGVPGIDGVDLKTDLEFTFEVFLRWAMKRQQAAIQHPPTTNLLTFRIEKEANP